MHLPRFSVKKNFMSSSSSRLAPNSALSNIQVFLGFSSCLLLMWCNRFLNGYNREWITGIHHPLPLFSPTGHGCRAVPQKSCWPERDIGPGEGGLAGGTPVVLRDCRLRGHGFWAGQGSCQETGTDWREVKGRRSSASSSKFITTPSSLPSQQSRETLFKKKIS